MDIIDPHQAISYTTRTPEKGEIDILVRSVGLLGLEVVQKLNMEIFREHRVINTFEHDDLLMLVAYVSGKPVGFKVGYRENRFTYYSAKGGVLSDFRRCNVARILLYDMMDRVRARGYARFAYDTFPNRHPGMTILGLNEGFRVMKADFNPTYKDYRLRFEKKLTANSP